MLVHSVFFDEPVGYAVVILLFVCSLVGLFFKQRQVLLVSLFLIGAGFGLLRFGSAIDSESSRILDRFVSENEKIIIHGSIIREPVYHSAYTEFVIHTDELVTYAELTLPVSTNIMVRTDNYTDYEYGQEVVVEGVLSKPSTFVTDSDRTFDYQSYLAKDDVYYTMFYATAMVFDEGNTSLRRSLYTLKHRFLDGIYRMIPEPESGLLAGILFGEPSALDAERENQFRIVGLMHIVVLSGYNVSLVIQIFTKLVAFLPRSIRAILAVLSIAAFAILVGAGPTVLRASIMAVFIVLADVLGTRYNITRALVIAGVCMVIWNPMVLYFDISFQLSFLATYGLIVLAPHVERWFAFLPRILAIRDSAVATVSAQIMVLPLILYSIGEFSLISPVVNVLVLFAVPVAMLTGFLTALSTIVFGVAPILNVVTTYLLQYQLWIVEFFSSFSFSYITIPPFHWSIACLMYLLLGWWILRIEHSQPNKV